MKGTKTDLETKLPPPLVLTSVGYLPKHDLLKLAQKDNELLHEAAVFHLKESYGIDHGFLDAKKLVIPRELVVMEDNSALMIFLKEFKEIDKLKFQALIFDEEIPHGKNLFNGQVLQYVAANFEALRYLDLEGCNLHNKDLPCLMRLPLLQYLNLSHCQNLDSSIMPDISQIKHLKVLNFENCDKISYLGISGLGESELKGQLEYLNANGCKKALFAGSLRAYFVKAVIIDHTGIHKPKIATEETKSGKIPSTSPSPAKEREQLQKLTQPESGCCVVS